MSLRPRVAAPLALASVLALHGLLVLSFLPAHAALSTSPMAGDDFDTHIGQTYRLLRALDQFGQHWGYDVQLLAGFPAGAIFDADNKGWSYFVYALWQGLDMAPGRAFNLFVLIAMASVPLVVYASGRLLRLEPLTSALAAFMGCLYWFYDSFVHWSWWVGMVAYAFAAYMALLPLACFYRFSRRPGWGWALATALALAPCLTLHPYTFFIVCAPMLVLYARVARAGGVRAHAWVLAIAVFAVLLNWPWLSVSLSHWGYILDSGFFAQGGLDFLAADLFNQVISPTDTGLVGTRATLRFLFGALSVLGLWYLRRARDDRFMPLAVGVGTLYALTYLGPIIPGAAQIQPYRHAAPAGFMAALPAASLLESWKPTRRLRDLTAPSRALLLIVLCFAGLRVVDDVLYFTPWLRPSVAPLIDGRPSPIDASGHRPGLAYVLPHGRGVHGGVDRLVAWASKNAGRGGRLLVEEMVLGERLAWRAGLEVMGGFRWRNLEHSHANLFRTHQGERIAPELLDDYVRTFAIDYIITRHEHEELQQMSHLLEDLGRMHERRVYRVKVEHPKVRGGPGVVQARMNRLTVTGTRPDAPVVLAYHYHPKLHCRPDCRVQRAPTRYDDVGLIRVPAPHPADFTIRLRY